MSLAPLCNAKRHSPIKTPSKAAAITVTLGGQNVRVLLGVTMDAKTRAIVLLKYKPMVEGFKNAIAEERKKGASEARIAAMVH